MKFRFSLRTMLILTTCVAALCWWRDRLRRVALAFVEAIDSGQYEEADALSTYLFDQSCVQFIQRNARNRLRAALVSPSAIEWLKSECRVLVKAHDARDLAGDFSILMLATRRGMGSKSVAELVQPVQNDIGQD